jgi:hypothetical protein
MDLLDKNNGVQPSSRPHHQHSTRQTRETRGIPPRLRIVGTVYLETPHAFYVFVASVSDSWFRRAFPIKLYNMSPQITPLTSPGSTENDNALVTDSVHGEQVAELEGRFRFVCTAGRLHISYVGQTIRKTKLYTPWRSTSSRASRCPRSDRAVESQISTFNTSPKSP